jgi:transposase InsO family protein
MSKANPLWGAPRIHGELLKVGIDVSESTVAKCMLRDRDGIYGSEFSRAVETLGIEEVLSAARSPWQNPFCERVIGSIRRECLDHVIILNEEHLRRILRSYFAYYHESRTHLSLDKDCPVPRAVQPPGMGDVVEFPQVGGLHHRYARRAA